MRKQSSQKQRYVFIHVNATWGGRVQWHFLTEGSLFSLRLIWATKTLLPLPGFWARQFWPAVIEACAQLPCLQTGSMPWGRTTPQTSSHHGLHYTPALDELLTMAPITCLPICCKGPNQPSCGLDFDKPNLSPGTPGPSCPLPLVCKWQNCLKNQWGFAYHLFC